MLVELKITHLGPKSSPSRLIQKCLPYQDTKATADFIQHLKVLNQAWLFPLPIKILTAVLISE